MSEDIYDEEDFEVEGAEEEEDDDGSVSLPVSRGGAGPSGKGRRGRPRKARPELSGMREGDVAEVPLPERGGRPRILRREVTRDEVLEAIPDSYGLATEMAERLGCTINAVNAVLDEHYEDIDKALEAEADHQEDLIVKSIIDDAKGGDAKARELFLKTLARRHSTGGGARGGSSGSVTVKFNMPEPASVTPENKSRAISEWEEKAVEFHREQTEKARGADIESLLSDARQMKVLRPGGAS